MKYAKTRSFLLIVCAACLLAAGALAAGQSAVTGCAYVDANQNGVCDGGEQLMAGAPVYLERLMNGEWTPMNNQQLTESSQGAFQFTGLENGTYRVVCPLENYRLYASSIGGAAETTADGMACSAAFDVAEGQTVDGMDIGLAESARVTLKATQGSRALPGVVMTLNGSLQLTTSADGQADRYVRPGQYTLTLTLPQGYSLTRQADSLDGQTIALTGGQTQAYELDARQAGSLSGMVFEDMNNNGVLDEGEPGVEGVTVHLEGKKSGAAMDVTSGEDGLYVFENLPDDVYTISAALPEGMLFARYSKTGGDLRSIFSGATRQRQYPVKNAAQVTDKNIGLVQKGAIRGTAFLDLNYNGVMDEGEPGYEGVTLEAIKISNGESLGKTVTGKDGSFALENLRGGDYRLRAILPDDGSIFTVTATADQGNRFEQKNGRRESSVQPYSIVSGGEAYALVGVARGATITGTVFEDADYNGVLNGKEKILSGLKVQAVDGDGNAVASDTTGAKGSYKLSGILPGTYTVQVQRKKGYGFTRVRDSEKGGNHVIALEGEMGVTAPITVTMGESYADVNAGMLPSSTVSGQLFQDSNDNGLWDENEPGMVQAQVRLYSQEAEIDLTQPVQADGSFFFDGVMPGEYTLTYVLPEHCEMARTADGGNTARATDITITVTMGEKAAAPLAGAVELGTYEGVAFHDANGNGVQDPGEEPVYGATLTFTPDRATASQVQVSSDVDGRFSVQGLRPANYTLSAEAADGMIFSHSPDGDGVLWPAQETASIARFPWTALTNRTPKALGLAQPGSIRGEIWMDENQNGKQGDGEWIMTGLTVTLTSEQGESVHAQTDEQGFRFDNVRPGTYTVSFELPAQSSPAGEGTFDLSGNTMRQQGVTMAEGQQRSGLNAGLVSRTSIGGKAYLDENGSRTPVEGITVRLMQDGKAAASAVTGEDGSYRFDGLWPGQYTLTASMPDGMIFVRPNDPNYPEGATVMSDRQGESVAIQLEMAKHQLDSNILYIKPAKVGDLAWLDENANGLLDGDEKRLPNIAVTLVQDGKVQYETATDAYGYYQFADVYPGTYVLVAHADTALTPTTPVTELRIISSCLTSGDGETAQSDPFDVVSGSDNRNFDLGYVLRDGQQLPESMAQPAPGRNWLKTNQE